MAEETWNSARLIPTSGINGSDEQERRATSALLAVLSAVREYGRALLQPFGAPAGKIETYIEVSFALGDQKVQPDGLIRVVRGKQSWTALVEVKTGANSLQAQQLENYLDVAREQGYQALITVSNEVAPIAGQHPTPVDKRRLKKVALHHWSWTQLLSEALMQKEHRGVADTDQEWILGELIRYLEHPRSGALEFSDMGSHWVPVREAVSHGTLRPSDKGVAEVCGRFDALLRYACLKLGRRLGTDVTPALSRKELAEPSLRTDALVASLCSTGTLQGSLRIPNTAGLVLLTANLKSGQVTCRVDVDAPKQGRPATRVNWLVRQLTSASDLLRIEAFTMHGRGEGATALLRDVRANPSLLIPDPKKDLKAFRLDRSFVLGIKRGRGRGSFIDGVLDAVETFHGEVMQSVKPWAASPPQLRETADPLPPALVSTALSSQDGPVTGNATAPPGASVPEQGAHEMRESDDQLNHGADPWLPA